MPYQRVAEKAKKLSSHLGVEPRTFGLEVQRAIHCANGTPDTHWLLKMVLFRNAEKMSTVPLQGLNIITEVYVFYISS